SDGSNLAAYLRALSRSDDEADRKAWQNIRHLVGRVAPFVKELSPVLVGSEEVPAAHERDIAPKQKARLDWIDERDRVFGPHHLSDGTLRFIALVTALAQPTHRRPSFISIDDRNPGGSGDAVADGTGCLRARGRRGGRACGCGD